MRGVLFLVVGTLVVGTAGQAMAEPLPRTDAKTTLTLSAPATARAGAAIKVTGALKSLGKAVKKAPILIQGRTGSTWQTLKTVKTDKKGKYAVSVGGFSQSTSVRAVFQAKGGFSKYKKRTSAVRTIQVTPLVPPLPPTPPTPPPPPPAPPTPPPPPPPPPSVATLDLVAGEKGVAYSAQLAAIDGTPPYTWSLVSGPLPAGLSLSSGGLLSGTPSATGTFGFTVRVTDGSARTADRALSLVIVSSGSGLPALPGSVVEAAQVLTTGPDPIQGGVGAGVLKDDQVAIVTGKVVKADSDEPVAGATVTILDHPELGSTKTFDDGQFALAVNAGGELVVNLNQGAFLPVQRIENIAWGTWHTVAVVQVTALDPNVGTVQQGGSAIQVVTGSTETDQAGERAATLMFDPGTTATMTLPNGDVEPLDGAMSVRATEYTVGQDFREAMPGQLPTSSGYTYAAEFSVDEALEAGATEVSFNKPVTTYVDNFLGLYPGTRVPAGYFDRERGRWVASRNGIVIDLVGEVDGKVLIDLDGDPAADPEKYAEFGIDDAERAKLAQLHPGTSTTNWVSLWRVEVEHFTPWDYNLPMGPPDGAGPPPGDGDGEGGKEGKKRPCAAKGSTILCESRVLQETIDATASPLTLTYSSDRVPGRKTARQLKIPVRDGSGVGPLEKIRVTVAIAGRTFRDEFEAADFPGSTYTFLWDGLDAAGEPLEGDVTASVTVGYGYEFVYRTPETFANSFARFGPSVELLPSRGAVRRWRWRWR